MSKIINLEDEFNSWFNAVEVFGLRSERFYHELNCYCTREIKSDLMLDWLKAAYMHGIKTAAQDSVDTLMDYSVSLEGCVDYELYPSQAYDSAAESLDAYWNDVLKDKE